jgi:hypothetical protein
MHGSVKEQQGGQSKAAAARAVQVLQHAGSHMISAVSSRRSGVFSGGSVRINACCGKEGMRTGFPTSCLVSPMA